MLSALAIVLAQAASMAWSGGRPPECDDVSVRAVNVWERAKSPELRRYCGLLASAASKLAGIGPTAKTALETAREARRLFPTYAAPRVLEGRALAVLGKYGEAFAALDDAKSRDPRALDDAPALLVWARTLARTGRHDLAVEAYRALLPRSSVLSTEERVSAEIEAALVAMTRGPGGVDEAVAALRDALREARDEAHPLAVLVLALALDRRESAGEARALLGEAGRGDPRDTLSSARAKGLLAVAPEEAHPLAALALETIDAAGARDEWQQALEAAPSGAWLAHARAHLAAVGAKRAATAEGRP